MPEYLSPGVYVEEVDTGTKPIEGVSTSTAGFIGVTQRGPVEGLPVLVTSFTEFRRRFGGYLPEQPWGDSRFLAYAVQGFFENGGQRAYIRRVPGDNAQRSQFDVPDGIVTRLQSDVAGGAMKVRLRSLRGVTQNTPLVFKETVGGAVVTETKNVSTFNSDTGEVTLAAGLTNSYTRDGVSVTVRPPAGVTLIVRARDHGKWGDDVRVKFDYTTPSRSAMVSGVSKTIGATMAPPLTLATGPDPVTDPAVATLGAGETARLELGDPLEFRNAANDRERRTVATKDANPNEITWAGNVTKDFSGVGRSVRTLVPPRALTLATGPDPVTNPKQATLGAGQAGLFRVGDTVEFASGSKKERRKITSVDLVSHLIKWAESVENTYGAGSTVRVLTAVRAGDPWLLLPSVAGLDAGDEITLSGDGQTEKVKIDAGWDGASNPVPLDTTTPVVNTYLEGVSVGQSTLALRAGTSIVRVQSARSFYKGALVELDNGTDDREFFLIDDISGNDIVLDGAAGSDFEIGNSVRLAEFRMSVRYLKEDERIDQTEVFDGLSMNPATGDRYVVTAVNARSELVRVTDAAGPAVAFDSPSTPDGSWQTLSGGDDGTPPPDDAFVGEDFGPGLRSGIQSFTDIDQVSIIAAPGKTSQVIQNALITHCEELMDRFAVLDPPAGLDIQKVQDFRSNYDTKYAALYYPWVTVRDPLVRDNRDVPPSGHVVGIYARTDEERGVHKAPANEVIRGIVDLEQIVNKREQDILNPSPVNINVLRDFRKSGRGLRVWGARCITSDTAWKYINVRRLFIYLEESIDEGTQWVVFEPNDEPLWARVRQSVTNFLTRVWRDGALMGATPEEAFFVRCDRTTMTQDDIDNGRLIMLVGVAAVKPAEFVIIRIGQFAGGSEVAEV